MINHSNIFLIVKDKKILIRIKKLTKKNLK